MSGSIRSRTMASNGLRACMARPAAPVPARATSKPRPAKIVAHHLGKAGVVFDQQNTVAHRDILTAPPAMPEASALAHLGQAVVDLAALLGRQHLGDIAKGLREAFAGGVGKRHLLGPKCLDRGLVDARLRQQHPPALARGKRLFAHRQQVLDGALDDGAQLLLLFVRRVDLDGKMPYAAVGAIFDACRVKCAAHEAGPCQYC